MALSDQDRGRALYHLNYALLATPTALSLGDPTVTQAKFLVEQNMLNFDDKHEGLVIQTLDRLDCIESEMDAVRGALIISRSGDTEFRDDALPQLEEQYERWQFRLANILAGQPNPVSVNALTQGRVIEGH